MTDEERLLAEKYGGEKTEGFFADYTRLQNGEPLAYLIGNIPFLSTTIYLDLPDGVHGDRPLIPRPETEFWVEQVIRDMQRSTPPSRVLDLCAGSGCIGVAVLKEVPETRVDFAEIDPGLHSVIANNIAKNTIDPLRTRIFGGSLFENISDATPYDWILTNPPYIDETLGRVTQSVRDYEPPRALYGGDSGLVLIREIIQTSMQYLTPTGTLVIEHEPEQAQFIQSLASECDFSTTTYTDQYGTERFTYLTRKTT
jgi:release factor glutamine methyltransferase